tara:strand:+ start:777 stop:1928 length:1152 start_codon:yes stop_codon:yes gene_type:complete
MKININNLIPKGWNIVNKGNKIKVSYQVKKGNSPKPIEFPKNIEIDEKFMEGLGLFLGDGDLNRKEKNHLNYVSKDKDIAKHALNFLQSKFNLKEENISFHIQYNKENKKMKEEWASFLDISPNKITTRFSERHRNECIQIQVNSVIFRKIFELTINKTLKTYNPKTQNLRRALIKGLFAAEGSIGIDYLEKKPYISQIVFDLHINETHIEKLITDILKKEKIIHKVNNRLDRNSKEIIIFNWNNYKKLEEMKTFDLCSRKKKKFYNLLKKLKIYCFLDRDYLIELFKKQNLKQKEIAKLIGSWQPNVSRLIKGKHQLSLEQYQLLANRINHRNPQSKIKSIRIGSLTHLENNKENRNFINYLYNIKATNSSDSSTSVVNTSL